VIDECRILGDERRLAGYGIGGLNEYGELRNEVTASQVIALGWMFRFTIFAVDDELKRFFEAYPSLA